MAEHYGEARETRRQSSGAAAALNSCQPAGDAWPPLLCSRIGRLISLPCAASRRRRLMNTSLPSCRVPRSRMCSADGRLSLLPSPVRCNVPLKQINSDCLSPSNQHIYINNKPLHLIKPPPNPLPSNDPDPPFHLLGPPLPLRPSPSPSSACRRPRSSSHLPPHLRAGLLSRPPWRRLSPCLGQWPPSSNSSTSLLSLLVRY